MRERRMNYLLAAPGSIHLVSVFRVEPERKSWRTTNVITSRLSTAGVTRCAETDLNGRIAITVLERGAESNSIAQNGHIVMT